VLPVLFEGDVKAVIELASFDRFSKTHLSFLDLIALRGATALSLARTYNPAAVTLDIWLPDLDGWKGLDAWKNDASTRHIPMHVISVDDRLKKALELWRGGRTHQAGDQEVTRPRVRSSGKRCRSCGQGRAGGRNDADVRAMMVDLIGTDDVHLTEISSGEDALGASIGTSSTASLSISI
jgi:CheY-like chemotaxis protein